MSVDAPPTRASNVLPTFAAATHPVAYVRFHGRNVKTWNIKAEKSWQRFDWMYSARSSRSGSSGSIDSPSEADEIYAMFNNNRDDFAPRSAAILRGLLDEGESPLAGGPSRHPCIRRSSEARNRRADSAERAWSLGRELGGASLAHEDPGPLVVLDAERPHRERLASRRGASHDHRHEPSLPPLGFRNHLEA